MTKRRSGMEFVDEFSAFRDPVWLKKGETVPFDCWGVTQEFMREAIEHTERR